MTLDWTVSTHTPRVSMHPKSIKGELESTALHSSHYSRIQSSDIWSTVCHASYLEEECAKSVGSRATPALSPAVCVFLLQFTLRILLRCTNFLLVFFLFHACFKYSLFLSTYTVFYLHGLLAFSHCKFSFSSIFINLFIFVHLLF